MTKFAGSKTDMRVIIFTNHFHPESFRCNDLAFELAEKGWQVKVMTSIPDYPEGHFHKGYSLFKKRKEIINGVQVVRVPVIPRGNGGKVRLSLNYLSSIVCFFFYGLWQTLFHRFDCVLVHDTSPAFICLPARRLAKIQKIPLHLWVLDMWPESLVCGGIDGGRVYGCVDKMMKKVYSSCSKIFVSSRGFVPKLIERGVLEEKIVYFPNWCDSDVDKSSSVVSLPELPDGFIVMFAGNVGDAQDVETVARAARMTSGHDIHWVFLGDGRKKAWLENFVAENGLEGNVHILGRFPSSAMKHFFSRADVMLVSLKSSLIGDMTLPARVQAFMSAGKPIAAMAGGETKEIIEAASCGWTIQPGNTAGLAETIIAASKFSADDLALLGNAGKDYCSKHFDKSQIIEKMNLTLSESVKSNRNKWYNS